MFEVHTVTEDNKTDLVATLPTLELAQDYVASVIDKDLTLSYAIMSKGSMIKFY